MCSEGVNLPRGSHMAAHNGFQRAESCSAPTLSCPLNPGKLSARNVSKDKRHQSRTDATRRTRGSDWAHVCPIADPRLRHETRNSLSSRRIIAPASRKEARARVGTKHENRLGFRGRQPAVRFAHGGCNRSRRAQTTSGQSCRGARSPAPKDRHSHERDHEWPASKVDREQYI